MSDLLDGVQLLLAKLPPRIGFCFRPKQRVSGLCAATRRASYRDPALSPLSSASGAAEEPAAPSGGMFRYALRIATDLGLPIDRYALRADSNSCAVRWKTVTAAPYPAPFVRQASRCALWRSYCTQCSR